jgi:hypothetical protein
MSPALFPQSSLAIQLPALCQLKKYHLVPEAFPRLLAKKDLNEPDALNPKQVRARQTRAALNKRRKRVLGGPGKKSHRPKSDVPKAPTKPFSPDRNNN